MHPDLIFHWKFSEKLSNFFGIYSELNCFWAERSHFPLYRSGEQLQSSCSGSKHLWHLSYCNHTSIISWPSCRNIATIQQLYCCHKAAKEAPPTQATATERLEKSSYSHKWGRLDMVIGPSWGKIIHQGREDSKYGTRFPFMSSKIKARWGSPIGIRISLR